MTIVLVNEEKFFHIPDIDFLSYCRSEYQVNRGIYNTIDGWFFKQGLTKIVERRKVIISFFEYMRVIQNSSRFINGSGGLTKRLIQFWEVRESKFLTLS